MRERAVCTARSSRCDLLWPSALSHLRLGRCLRGWLGSRLPGFLVFLGTAANQCRGIFGVEGQASHALLARRAKGYIHAPVRSEEHTSELQSPDHLLSLLLL